MTSDQAIPGVLVLYPLKFAGATSGVIVDPAPPAGTPVEGLPQSSFKEVIRRDGSREGAVQAIVDPPTGGSYLNIALYVKGPRDTQRQLLERKPVPTADQNKQTSFNVFQSSLNDGVHVFTYDVERVSGNASTSTESWALYYRDLPGGNDVPGSGAHPDLTLSLPAELGDPPQIGKDEVDKGVPMTLSYPFMRAYDLITLELSRERFTYTVQPGQEGRPYVITVTRAMFELAGSNVRFPIAYTVVDQVNNPTDKRRWSRTIEANVDTELVTLQPAILREILTENNDESAEVDLGKMNGGPLWALIHLVTQIWATGDEIHLVFTAMLEGKQVATHEATLPITQVPGQFSWDIPNAKVIEDAKVRVVYEQLKDGKVIGISSAAEAQVTGTGVPEFIVDTPVRLSGPNVSIAGSELENQWVLTGDYPAGATAKINVSGGVRPYTFATSDALIVSVNSEGFIESQGNGEAIITVTDSALQRRSVEVFCENVTRVLFSSTLMTHTESVQWVRNMGGTVIPQQETDARILIISRKYSYIVGYLYYCGNPSVDSSCFFYQGVEHSSSPSKWWSGYTGGTNRFPVLCFKS